MWPLATQFNATPPARHRLGISYSLASVRTMRSTISYREETGTERLQKGMVSLKLFNILLKEIGPAFLEKGIWVHGKDLQNFIEGKLDDFSTGCKKAILDGKEVNLKTLPEMKWADKDVFLLLRAD